MSFEISMTGSIVHDSENIQKRINEYYFRTTESQRKNVELVQKSSHDLFQNNENEGEKEADSNGVNKIATEFNMNSTTELEEQVGASGKAR